MGRGSRPRPRRVGVSLYFDASRFFASLPRSRPALGDLLSSVGYVRTGRDAPAFFRLLDSLMETVVDKTSVVPAVRDDLMVTW